MQARGILSPSAVLDVIKNPARMLPGNSPGTIVFISNNLKIITNHAGDVITVILIRILTTMILRSGDAYVQINVAGRSYPNSGDYWDGNWLESEIKINSSGFKSIYGTNLRADDFQRFYEALEKLSNNLTKEVEFTTMEEGLYLKGQLDVTGNIKWEGVAKSEPGGNSLTFFIETDNASIGKLAKEVKEISDMYPVVGSIS